MVVKKEGGGERREEREMGVGGNFLILNVGLTLSEIIKVRS